MTDAQKLRLFDLAVQQRNAAWDKLDEAVAYLGRTPAAAIVNRDLIERLK